MATQERSQGTEQASAGRRGSLARAQNGSPSRNGSGINARTAGIGWFSLGLGLAQLVAPRSVGRLVGAGDDERTAKAMRALGGRELASGVAILTRKESSVWLWGRFAGDLMDLALLASSSRRKSSNSTRLLAAGAAVVGVTILDGLAALEASRSDRENGRSAGPAPERTVVVKRWLSINKPPEEVYAFLRDFRNAPRFMGHIESVEVDGPRSRWRAKGPAGMNLTWDAEIYDELPSQSLRWRSLPGAAFENEGSIQLRKAPGARGTELGLELRYEPPLGLVGLSLAKLFGGIPSQKILNDLRRLKQILETGEVVHSDASIHAGPHPAQPSRDSEKRVSP